MIAVIPFFRLSAVFAVRSSSRKAASSCVPSASVLSAIVPSSSPLSSPAVPSCVSVPKSARSDSFTDKASMTGRDTYSFTSREVNIPSCPISVGTDSASLVGIRNAPAMHTPAKTIQQKTKSFFMRTPPARSLYTLPITHLPNRSLILPWMHTKRPLVHIRVPLSQDSLSWPTR